jgi:hypothetical protein
MRQSCQGCSYRELTLLCQEPVEAISWDLSSQVRNHSELRVPQTNHASEPDEPLTLPGPPVPRKVSRKSSDLYVGVAAVVQQMEAKTPQLHICETICI